MVSSRSLVFFLYAVFILIVQLAVARPDFLYNFCLNDKGNYTANSTYEANFNDLLFSLSSNTEIDSGFYHSAYGQNSDKVYGIGLCRGDVNPDVCRGCLNNAASLLTERCPKQKEAIWYDECMLRYSNRSILGVVETSPSFYMWNPYNLSANYVEQFNGVLRTLLEILRSQAAAGGPDLKFAAGNATAPNFQTLYALVQCTPDLFEQDCNNCLVGAFQDIPLCCDGKQGGRVIMPSCNIRYEVYQFYNPTTAASQRSTQTNYTNKREVFAADHSRRSSIFVINIFVIIVAAMVLSISIGLGVYRSVKRIWNNDGTSNEITSVEMESLQVDDGSEAKSGYFYERYTQIRKKLSSIRKKKDRSFVSTAIDDENEIPGLISHPMPDRSSESDDDSVNQLLREKLRSLKGLRHPSSFSPRSSHVSQLTRELNEYKWRCEEAEREVHKQQEK